MVTIVAINTPKCTGSTPAFFIIGLRKSGQQREKFTLLSRNQTHDKQEHQNDEQQLRTAGW
ncbi:MAG: hypothetical protein ACLUHE_08985 [Christensenellales bacterium]